MEQDEIQNGEIRETEWKHGTNQLVDTKHIYARKDGKIAVVSALKTYGISFNAIPTIMNAEPYIMDFIPTKNSYKDARKNIELWLLQ